MTKKNKASILELGKELLKLNPIKAVIITLITKGGSYEFEITKGKKS